MIRSIDCFHHLRDDFVVVEIMGDAISSCITGIRLIGQGYTLFFTKGIRLCLGGGGCKQRKGIRAFYETLCQVFQILRRNVGFSLDSSLGKVINFGMNSVDCIKRRDFHGALLNLFMKQGSN